MRRADRSRDNRARGVMLISFGLFAPLSLGADPEVEKPRLVDHVAGNCYERRVLEADGTLSGLQRIFVHEWTRDADGDYARIDVVRFRVGADDEEKPEVEEKFDFRIVGEVAGEAEEGTALQIIGHLGEKERISLKFLGENSIYPDGQCQAELLPPVRFDAKVERGLVDLLGGRAEIRIVDRICRAQPSAAAGAQPYVISGELRMDMFLLGIRFGKKRYDSRQRVDPASGLVQYVLEDDDGGRQELELVEHAACSPPWMADSP